MVHPTDTPVTDPAVVTVFRFVRLTDGTHGEKVATDAVLLGWNCGGGYGAGVGEGRFGVGGECEGAECAVDDGDC